jgi:hypothetical protein
VCFTNLLSWGKARGTPTNPGKLAGRLRELDGIAAIDSRCQRTVVRYSPFAPFVAGCTGKCRNRKKDVAERPRPRLAVGNSS